MFLSCMVSMSAVALNTDISTNTVWDLGINIPSSVPNATWDGVNTLTFDDNLVVLNGVTLEITDIQLRFKNGKNFVVGKGSHLKMTNGNIAPEPGHVYWHAIQATGFNDVPQYKAGNSSYVPPPYEAANILTRYDSTQTIVELTNVELILSEHGVYSQFGAILIIKGCTFTDCKTGVDIRHYKHPTFGGILELDRRNACYVENCVFNVTTVTTFWGTPQYDFAEYKQIVLGNVWGVHISGCAFTNSNTSIASCDDRGMGIWAYTASFAIHQSGNVSLDMGNCAIYDGSVNTFSGFSYGIYADGFPIALGNQHGPSISHCQIQKCENGIFAQRYAKAIISDNTITLDDDAGTTNTCLSLSMIRVLNVTEFVIQRNVLNVEGLTVGRQVTMIDAHNGGIHSHNKIYKNTLTNTAPIYPSAGQFTGIRLSGTQNEIDVWCNSFTDIRYGITILDGTDINPVWRKSGIGIGDDVNNTFFFNIADRIIDLNNLSSTTITYYADNTYYSGLIKNGPWFWGPPDSEALNCDDFPCEVWPVSIREFEPLNIEAYPNPLLKDGILELRFDETFTGEISVYDALGRALGSYTSYYQTSMQLDFQPLKLIPGMYFLVAVSDEGVRSSLKIVVQE